MKIALIRGDFAAPSELTNFRPLLKEHEVTLFTGFMPVWDLSKISGFQLVKLFSPVDFNLGKISRFRMAVLNRLFTDAHVLFGLENELKGFDIAHCAETYYSFTQQCINAKEKGCIKKIVSTVWENIPFNNEAISGRKYFKKRALKNIDLFLAVTDSAKDVLIQEGCAVSKVAVLKPGVDLTVFKPARISRFRQLVRSSRVKLTVVCRLVPEKGVLETLDLYKKLKAICLDVELIIVGTGPLKQKIEEAIIKNQIRDVTLLGKVDYLDMPKIYSLSDILIHYPVGSPTWSEQYGMVLLEAMACGLPVVALDVGSSKEVINQGGIVVGRDKLLIAIRDLVFDRTHRLKISRNAYNYARLTYDSRQYAKKLEALYENMLLTKD